MFEIKRYSGDQYGNIDEQYIERLLNEGWELIGYAFEGTRHREHFLFKRFKKADA